MNVASVVTTETDPRVTTLRRQLDEFYTTTNDYSDFNKVVNFKPEFWATFVPAIQEVVQRKGSCRVLEFGAGRTGFSTYLGELRKQVHFTVQDVTPQNVDHLHTQADEVHIGDLLALQGQFDIIFSTFVWEHVTNPRQTLEHLLKMLMPGGSLFIACPRYDQFFYIPPSSRHYGLMDRIKVGCWLGHKRWLGGRRKAHFSIHVDPAVLKKPWFRDSDAIHWVSINDFRRSLPAGHSLSMQTTPVNSFKGWVWRTFLLAFVRIQRKDLPKTTTPAHRP